MNIRETHNIGPNTQERICARELFHTDLSPQIQLAGLSAAHDEFSFVRLNWENAQVLACYDGRGEVLIHNQWRPCLPGQAYITPPHVPHAYRATKNSVWRICWVILDINHSQLDFWGAHPRLQQIDPRPLRDTIINLYREAGSRNDPQTIRSWADMVHLQAMLISRSGEPDILWPLWEEVMADLSRPWTVEGMAALLSLSGEHLRRLCHRQLNRSPMEHVTHLRMIRAAAMLVGSTSKIDAIAAATGYSTRFAFSTAFGRYYGTSPAQYRKKLHA